MASEILGGSVTLVIPTENIREVVNAIRTGIKYSSDLEVHQSTKIALIAWCNEMYREVSRANDVFAMAETKEDGDGQ